MGEIYHEMKIQLSSHIKFTEIQVPVKYFYALKGIIQLHEQGEWKTYTFFPWTSMMITLQIILKTSVISLIEDFSHLLWF